MTDQLLAAAIWQEFLGYMACSIPTATCYAYLKGSRVIEANGGAWTKALTGRLQPIVRRALDHTAKGRSITLTGVHSPHPSCETRLTLPQSTIQPARPT